MHLADFIRYAVAIALSGVLAWAAISDIRWRRIPNRVVLSILVLFVPWTLASGGIELASALVAGVVAFAVGYGLYAFKVMGAGDAKLFASLALFAGLAHLTTFALATVWTGGVLAIGALVARPRRALAMLSLRGQGDHGRGIPYGVAIGVGGAVVLWGYLTGLLPLHGGALG
ncbi:MAG TPA: prepilin peptidase [Phenylobacterium sp.]|jgi:prepilin peptidase CpaA|nr:prepilin peptidase [Phenylobacterium sp.]